MRPQIRPDIRASRRAELARRTEYRHRPGEGCQMERTCRTSRTATTEPRRHSVAEPRGSAGWPSIRLLLHQPSSSPGLRPPPPPRPRELLNGPQPAQPRAAALGRSPIARTAPVTRTTKRPVHRRARRRLPPQCRPRVAPSRGVLLDCVSQSCAQIQHVFLALPSGLKSQAPGLRCPACTASRGTDPVRTSSRAPLRPN